MGVKYIKRFIQQDLSKADLTLEAVVGKGFEIESIGIHGGATGLVARVIIGGENILCFPADAGAEMVAPVLGKHTNLHGLFETIRKIHPDVPLLKVSEGETLIVSSAKAAGTAYVRYKEFKADQIPKKTDPGGSESDIRLVVFHNKAEWDVAAGATEVHLVDKNLNPSGYPSWVGEEKGPVGFEYHVLGFATSKGAGSGPNISYKGVRMIKMNEFFLAPDEAFVDPEVFPYNRDDINKPMFLFPKPIVFKAGETFKVEVQAYNAGTTDETAQIFITYFVLQKPV